MTGPDAAARAGQHHPLPLVVDLDGTLTPTDTLVESFLRLLRWRPWAALIVLASLFRGRAAFKRRVAEQLPFDAGSLPLREDLLQYLLAARQGGRRLVLATAADARIAQPVADRLAIFDTVLCSNGTDNLKGRAKLAKIQATVGPDFVYAGDSRADLPIWRAARAAVLVDVPASVARQVRHTTPVEQAFDQRGHPLARWARALRLHQCLKNALVFLPLLTSFSFGKPDKVLAAVLAFVALCLMASATYIANDLWDLDSDRQHPRKRQRPFASGTLPIVHGMLVALGLLVASLVLAARLSPAFLGIVCSYLLVTSVYSWVLKRHVLLDVIALGGLYALRVLAGAVAIGVQVTPWLLAFCVFIFLSLALVKRCSELVSLRDEGDSVAPGRDYRVTDLVVLWPLGVGSALSAIVVFGLFVASVAESSRYANANLLWAVGVGLIYWMGRLWIKTARGEMHDDPVVFTLRDVVSRTVLICMVLATVAAHFPGLSR